MASGFRFNNTRIIRQQDDRDRARQPITIHFNIHINCTMLGTALRNPGQTTTEV